MVVNGEEIRDLPRSTAGVLTIPLENVPGIKHYYFERLLYFEDGSSDIRSGNWSPSISLGNQGSHAGNLPGFEAEVNQNAPLFGGDCPERNSEK